jgi:hypothetical protein
MDKKPFNGVNIDPASEIAVFEEGKQSIFWLTFKQRFTEIVRSCQSSLKSVDCPNRDFIAGKVNALESIFNYPEKHIRTLRDIESKKEKKND